MSTPIIFVEAYDLVQLYTHAANVDFEPFTLFLFSVWYFKMWLCCKELISDCINPFMLAYVTHTLIVETKSVLFLCRIGPTCFGPCLYY